MNKSRYVLSVFSPPTRGMSPGLLAGLDGPAGFPRPHGDDPVSTGLDSLSLMFSPLTRG